MNKRHKRVFHAFGPADALHGIRCQSCGYEAWSLTGNPARCRICGGLMVDEDMVDEDMEQMRRELGTARPVRDKEEDADYDVV